MKKLLVLKTNAYTTLATVSEDEIKVFMGTHIELANINTTNEALDYIHKIGYFDDTDWQVVNDFNISDNDECEILAEVEYK